jgi:hypothetical protein
MQPKVAYMCLIVMRKQKVVKRRAGCFQKVDHVRTPSLLRLLKEAPWGVLLEGGFHRVHSCSAKNLVAQPVGRTKNLSLPAASITFLPILSWSLLQDCIFAHLLWSRRGTWYSLQRKKKMLYKASRDEQSVASSHRSLAASLQRREAWESR